MNTIVKAASAALLSVGSAFLPLTVSAGTWEYHGPWTGYQGYSWASDGNWELILSSWDDTSFKFQRGDRGVVGKGEGVLDLAAAEDSFAPRKMVWQSWQFKTQSVITGVVFPPSMTNSETAVTFVEQAFDGTGITELDLSTFKSAVNFNKSSWPCLTKIVYPQAQTQINTGAAEKCPAVTEIYMPGNALTGVTSKGLTTTDYQVRLYCDPIYDSAWTDGNKVGGKYAISPISDDDRASEFYASYGLSSVEAEGNLIGTIQPDSNGKMWLIRWKSPYRREGFRVAVDIPKTSLGQVLISPDGDDGFYQAGEVVTLTATPANGCYFVKWAGDLPSTALSERSELTITVERAISLTAYFASKTWEYHGAWTGYDGYQWISDGNWDLILGTWSDTDLSIARADRGSIKAGVGTLNLDKIEKAFAPRRLTLVQWQLLNDTSVDKLIFPTSMVESENPVTLPSEAFKNCVLKELDFGAFKSPVNFGQGNKPTLLEKIVYPVAQVSIATGGESYYPALTEAYMAGKAFSSITYKGFNTTDYQVRVYIDPTMDKKWNKGGLFGGTYTISAITDTDRADSHYTDYGLAEVEARGDLLGTMKPNSNGRMWIIRWTSPAKRPGMKLIFK